jgi:diguanylate cyclase
MPHNRIEDIKAAGLKSRVAMAWLRDHHLPADPLCYTIAYEYLHTNDAELKQKVDVLELTASNFHKQLDEVYQNHILVKRYEQLAMRTGHVSEYVSDLLKLLVRDYEIPSDISGHILSIKKVLGEEQDALDHIDITEGHDNYLQIMETTSHDEMTGLLDKNGLYATLQEAVQDADNHPMSMILMDIDKFALFNDAHGKIMGNAVLKHIGKLSGNFFKGTDIVSRLESDKFIIVLPKTASMYGIKIADELRKKIAALSLKKKASMTAAKFTVSMGISEISPKVSVAEAMERARKALDRSIDLGRNCVNCEK